MFTRAFFSKENMQRRAFSLLFFEQVIMKKDINFPEISDF